MFSTKEKLLLLALAFIQFCHIVDFMIMMPLGPQLMRLFEINAHQFGMLVSTYTFAAGATGILSAFFIDRFDRKKTLMLFYVGFFVGTLACAFANNYQSLLIARAFTGAFGGILGSLVLSIVSDSINPERRGTALGIVMASFSLASIFGVPFSLYLANIFSWHAPFLFLGGISALLTLGVFFVLPPMSDHLKNQSIESPWQRVAHCFTNSNQQTALIFMMLLVLGQFAVIPFLSQSMVFNGGMTEAQLPLIYLAGGLFSIVTSPLIGKMSDKVGKRKVFYVGAGASIIPLLVITNLGVSPLYILLSSSVFFFVVMGGRMIPAMAMVTSTVKPQQRGSFMSVMSSIQQFSSALASYASGLIVVKTAEGHLVNYPIVGLISVAFTLAAMFAASKIVPIEGTI